MVEKGHEIYEKQTCMSNHVLGFISLTVILRRARDAMQLLIFDPFDSPHLSTI